MVVGIKALHGREKSGKMERRRKIERNQRKERWNRKSVFLREEYIMRKETAAGWLTAILTCALLTGCGSQAAGAARTAAAIESQAGSTEEIADHSEEKAEKPRVVLHQEEMGKETERSESEAGTEPEPETDTPDPYADLLKDPEVMAANKIYAKETAEPGKTRIVFAGDILFDSHYAIMASLLKRGQGIEGGISADLLSIMRNADIFMVNNEFPYTNRGMPTDGKKFTFRADPKYASWLFDMGADLVSLANNHAYDYGEVSLTDTLDTLESIGMPYVGAGRNLEEAVKPVSFIANGKKFTFISATQIERLNPPDTKGATETSPGVFRCLDITKLLEVIGEARADSDYVIVYIHWGTEGTDKLDHWQTEQAAQIAAAGVDLIIGDHPHVLQPIGYVGEVPVVYSLGNYLFNSKSLDTCLVEAVFGTEGLESLQFIPAKQENCRVTKAEGAEKDRILAYMREISPETLIDDNGFITAR